MDDQANVLEYAEPENRAEELRRAVAAAAAGAIFVGLAWTGLTDQFGRGWWVVPWLFAGMIVAAALWAGRGRKPWRTAMERRLVSVAIVLLLSGSVGGGLGVARVSSGFRCAYPVVLECYNENVTLRNALGMYAAEHRGRFPDRVEELTAGNRPYFDAKRLAALGETARPGRGAATRPAPGPVACWYLGTGETTASPPSTVLFVEQSWRHAGGSLHVVTVGGGATLLQGTDAATVMRQLSQGTRPVMWPATSGATTRPVASVSVTGSRSSP